MEIRGMAWPALSPDGKTLAFEWLNDIWLAPTRGGDAIRVVTSPEREAYPKFTPDGKRLVFCSERTGSSQIWSIKIDGNDLKQHSDHSEGYVLEGISPDSRIAIARGERASSGYKPFRPLRVSLVDRRRELRLFDATAHSISVSPDGERYLFCEGGEQLYRKGYKGSRASKVHLYDARERQFTPLIMEDWEAKSPLWRADGRGFYFISNRGGTSNLWMRDLENESDKQQTFFNGPSLVIPALSADGSVMVFRAGHRVYRFHPDTGEKPVEVKFFTSEGKISKELVRRERVSGTSAVTFGGEQRIVFTAAGELWTMKRSGEPVRLTMTDELDELEPQLSLDGGLLFFLRDDGLKMEVCRAEFSDGVMGDIYVMPTGTRSKRSLRISPDGAWLSWIEATGDVVTAPSSGTGEMKVVMHGWDPPTYDWAPNGKWLVVGKKDLHANRDIWLVPADGSAAPVNVTRHPAFEGSPKWSPDGTTIAFVARREQDEMARFWTIDVRNLGEKNFDRIAASAKKVNTDVSEPIRVVWTADSESLLFQSRDTEDRTVYSVSVDTGEVNEFAALRGIPLGVDESGSSYWRIDRKPVIFNEGDMDKFDFSFAVQQDRSARLRLGFRRIWRTLEERFYDKTMNRTDWDAVRERYENAAAEARESRQFDRVIAQLLGELNSSHLTFRSKKWGLKGKRVKIKQPTAHPGLIFSASWSGPLVIERVIAGSPISMVKGAPTPGDQVIRIAGKEVDAKSNLGNFFNGAQGKPLPIVIEGSDGGQRTMELMPVGYDKIRRMNREGKKKKADRMARKMKFAYLPFRKMKSDDLRDLSVEVYRASLDAEGLILDLRDNAGGRVADELLGLFCQPQHTFTIPRDGPRGYPADRRISPSWEKPMVVLCNENTFSNAEIFCHAFKRLGRGKLIGMPTNGGVISAVSVSIPEVGELQIPFRGWFHAETGEDLELNGAVPDVLVRLLPEDQVRGVDSQLVTAINVLSEEVGDGEQKVKALYKGKK